MSSWVKQIRAARPFSARNTAGINWTDQRKPSTSAGKKTLKTRHCIVFASTDVSLTFLASSILFSKMYVMQFLTTSSLRALLAITLPFLSTISPVGSDSRQSSITSVRMSVSLNTPSHNWKSLHIQIKHKYSFSPSVHPAHPEGVRRAPCFSALL